VSVRPAVLVAVATCLAIITPAHADTFNFSFTTDALRAALASANPSTFSTDGYFAAFLQVDAVHVPNVTSLTAVSTPYNYGAGQLDGWVTGAFNDDADIDLVMPGVQTHFGGGDWIYFAKDPTQTTTRLFTVTNIYTGDFFPLDPVNPGGAPTGYGDRSQISGTLPDGDFTLQLVTEDDIPQPLTLHGFASTIEPDNPGLYGGILGGKVVIGRPFTLHVTPEPGTFVLLGLGLAGAIGLRIRQQKRS
jgi:hypothetical protein